MGLTVLAWGNSISDFIANVSVARRGLPEMAIAASYSAPLTNLLLGLGFAFASKILKSGTPIFLHISAQGQSDLTNTIYFSFCFLLASLLITLIVVPCSKYYYRRPVGILLMAIYVVFMLISALALYKVMLPSTNLWLL